MVKSLPNLKVTPDSPPNSRKSSSVIMMAKKKNETTFVCKECGKEFARLNRLRAHMHMHNGT